MKHSLRSSQTGRFIKSTKNIVAGRLYGYKGTVVRAKKLCNNGMRHVTFHKALHGFVPDNELEIIDSQKVNAYLSAPSSS